MALFHFIRSSEPPPRSYYITIYKPAFHIIKDFNSFSQEIKKLIITNIILAIGLGLGGTFLNIFIWRQVHDFYTIALFYLVQYPIILSSFLLAGTIKIKLYMRTLMQIGFLFYIITFLLLLIFKEHIVSYIWLLGIVYAAGIGISSTGNTTFQYVVTKDENRDKYYSFTLSVNYFISIGTPIIAGLLLSKTFFQASIDIHYYLLFFISICILILGLLYTASLPSVVLPKFTLKEVIAPIKYTPWRLVTLSAFIDGFKGGIEGFIASILLFQILTKEINMGIYSSILAFLSAVVAYYVGMMLRRNNRLTVGLIGVLLVLLDHVVYILFFSFKSLVISSLIGAVSFQLFTLGLVSTFFDMVDHSAKHEKAYFTYIAFKEIPFGIGRVTGVILFIIFLHFGNNIQIAKIWYLILGVMPLIYFFLIKKFENMIKIS